MEPKEYIPLVLSSMALLLSIVNFVISMVQKRSEVQRMLRSHLTDVLSKLTTTNLELSKAKASPETNGAMIGHFLDQRRSYMKQADFVAQQIPELVGDIEYAIIA